MKNEVYGRHQSSIFNIDANVLGLIAYFSGMIIGWIPVIKVVAFFAPLIIYLVEKNSNFVKFHSMQAFLLSIISSAVTFIYGILAGASALSAFGGNIVTTMTAGGFALLFSMVYIVYLCAAGIYMIIAAIKAAQYKEYHIPLVGDWAAKITNV